MKNKFLNLILSLTILQLHLKSQDNPVMFYEVIKDDSVMLFFNNSYSFTEKKCAIYKRFIRIDGNGDFNGSFSDIGIDNNVIGKGKYKNGIKQGPFETFYLNGKLKSKGNYISNLPYGLWRFYNEEGNPERILQINSKDTLLLTFYDKKGVMKVSNGNGDFYGLISAQSILSSDLLAKGKIVNGKPDGKWSFSTMNNIEYTDEVFNNGRFVEGIYSNGKNGGNKRYNLRSVLNSFILPSYFEYLENFSVVKCRDSTVIKSKNYNFDLNNLGSVIERKIKEIIQNDIRNGNDIDYSFGEKFFTVQFSIDEQGKPRNFSQVSSWGGQFYSAIVNALQMQVVFPPTVKTMYFHIKFTFKNNYMYSFNYRFSGNSQNF